MDTTGGEVKDSIDAANEEEAQQKIRSMGYFVTRLTEVAAKTKEGQEKSRQGRAKKSKKGKVLVAGRRQVEAARDLHPAILRPCRTPACPCCAASKILEGQMKPGVLKNALIDVVDDVESGCTLSARRSASIPSASTGSTSTWCGPARRAAPWKSFLRRLAEFKEKAESLARKIKGAMIYPIVVVSVAVAILSFIMIFIIPKFEKIFKDFKHQAALDHRVPDRHRRAGSSSSGTSSR